jgi:hypothetical protein
MVAMNVWPTDAADGSVSSEARWRKMARYWAPTGVCAGTGLELAPSLVYPNLTVRNGAAWVDGHFCELLGDQVLAVTPNGLVVVRFDPAANTAQLLYLDGVSVPAQSPTGIYELPIAKITGSALTDLRSVLAASGRNPVVLTGNAQAVANATVVDVAWDTELADVDGWHPAGTGALLTVPAGKGGQYTITYIGSWSASPGAGGSATLEIAGSRIADVPASTGIFLFANVLTVVRTLAPGDTIKASVYQNSTAVRTISSRLEIR